MTTVLEQPPPMRRFSTKKLKAVLRRLGKKPAWLASEADVSEQSVRNWLAGKKPDLDSYLDLVDALERVGVKESEILEHSP